MVDPEKGPEGPKKLFLETGRRPPPPLSKGLDDHLPACLKVWTGTAYHANTVIENILEPGHITFHCVTTATMRRLIPRGDWPVLCEVTKTV